MKKTTRIAVRAGSLAGVTVVGSGAITLVEAVIGVTPAGASATCAPTPLTNGIEVCEHIEGSGQNVTADYGTVYDTTLNFSAMGGHLQFTGPSVPSNTNTSPDIIWYGASEPCNKVGLEAHPVYDSRKWTFYNTCQGWNLPSNNVNWTDLNAATGNYAVTDWQTFTPNNGGGWIRGNSAIVTVTANTGGLFK